MSWSLAEQRLAEPLGAMGAWAMPLPQERRQMFEFFATHGETPIAQMLSEFPAPRRPFLERGVLWLVKFGILRLSADGPFVRNPT